MSAIVPVLPVGDKARTNNSLSPGCSIVWEGIFLWLRFLCCSFPLDDLLATMLEALQIPFFHLSMDTDLCCASSVSCGNTVVNKLVIVGFFQIANKMENSQCSSVWVGLLSSVWSIHAFTLTISMGMVWTCSKSLDTAQLRQMLNDQTLNNYR